VQDSADELGSMQDYVLIGIFMRRARRTTFGYRALAAAPIIPMRAAKVLLPGPASDAERTQRGGCSCVAALSLGRAR